MDQNSNSNIFNFLLNDENKKKNQFNKRNQNEKN